MRYFLSCHSRRRPGLGKRIFPYVADRCKLIKKTARGGETEEPAEIEHHFICYVVKDNVLYEIDSSSPGKALVSAAGGHIKMLMEHIGDRSFLVPSV
ncbi:unnamed protein product [Nippostrongylus brasiliensis]|uniref:ubiquitinyl hydrolase 1 n=1 Tax=Nippostrongylus brasiliensis TaxID=27835 RepID=A0A0N4YCS7_NIPBR|nr:unnamed protein product [Nippostrongylus brasiliensis]